MTSACLHLYAPAESSCPPLCEHHEQVVLIEERLRNEDSRLAPEIGERKFLGGDIGVPHRGVRNVSKWLGCPTSDFQTCRGHSISQMAELDQKGRVTPRYPTPGRSSPAGTVPRSVRGTPGRREADGGSVGFTVRSSAIRRGGWRPRRQCPNSCLVAIAQSGRWTGT